LKSPPVGRYVHISLHARDPDYSVLDLQADCRGAKYVAETIQMLPDKPEPILLAKIFHQVTLIM